MTIEGKQIIGYDFVSSGTETFRSYNPARRAKLDYQFVKATPDESNLACEKAASAFQLYRKLPGVGKAQFLESIVKELQAIGDQLVETCCAETALPKARVEGERTRTLNQLLMFANLLREGSWVDARIEMADPQRTPLPKPDIRYMHVGLGPVVVFGASNFPLAFSVAGGDTASAFAAGCPVIVKAHSGHPATSELAGRAIQRAAKNCNMPDGVFSMLHGDGSVVGTRLVRHKAIKAVGLTGSFQAGKSLFDVAASRDEPIPVYAEMGSTNPVFILPEAMRMNSEKIAQGFSASATLSVGQFCTNPGLLLHQRGDGAVQFTHQVREEFNKTVGGIMLTETIFKSFRKGVEHHSTQPGIEVLASGSQTDDAIQAKPILFKTTGEVFKAHGSLAEEIFGPASLVVELNSREEMLEAAKNLSGHLTATIHGTDNDLSEYRDLLQILEQKVGRIIINGFPTGVEVCTAMVHGGPYPATTDGKSTSVGTAAIFRFTRAICYQGMPQTLLPPELQNENPLHIWRSVNGERTKGGLYTSF